MTVPSTNLGDRMRALAAGHPQQAELEAAADTFDQAVAAHRAVSPDLVEDDSETAQAMLAAHTSAVALYESCL